MSDVNNNHFDCFDLIHLVVYDDIWILHPCHFIMLLYSHRRSGALNILTYYGSLFACLFEVLSSLALLNGLRESLCPKFALLYAERGGGIRESLP